MAKRISFRKIKSNQSCTVEEAAEVLGVTKPTVRAWIKAGLPALNAQRPTLILGFQLRAYLQHRASQMKQPTAMGEFYCLRCRKPQKPFGMMADYIPMNGIKGRLVALCEVCEGTCNRITSKASLQELSRVLEIATGQISQD